MRLQERITDEEFVEAIRALADRGMVEITRDVDTDIVRVGLTPAGWAVLEEASS